MSKYASAKGIDHLFVDFFPSNKTGPLYLGFNENIKKLEVPLSFVINSFLLAQPNKTKGRILYPMDTFPNS